MMAGASIIVVDNVASRLTSPQLAGAITVDWWEDRELGRSSVVRVQQRATWALTGNNILLGGDLPRRSYHIRLDAQMARPWEREEFGIPNLRHYVVEQRAAVLAALLTLARARYAAGQPAAPGRPLGGFEGWNRVVGGILKFAGFDGFLGNQEEMYDAADDGTGHRQYPRGHRYEDC